MSDRLRELTDAELEVVAGAGWGNVICRALMGALAGGEIAGPIGAIAGALICGGDAAIRDFG